MLLHSCHVCAFSICCLFVCKRDCISFVLLVDDAGQQQSDEIRVPEYLEFEEGKDDLTGSRSSSAQDQGLDETESAPESEIDPARGMDDNCICVLDIFLWCLHLCN